MDLGEHFLDVARSRFRWMKGQAEQALGQVPDEALNWSPDAESNSLAVLAQHIGGNLKSRFTDFLTSDGEKPDRDRDGEFLDPRLGRAELMERWEAGWSALLESLAAMSTADLARTVTIRGQEFTAMEAIERALLHIMSHVGQMVYLAKHLAGVKWKTLSIPRGQSAGWKP
jgi:hypothetical protein